MTEKYEKFIKNFEIVIVQDAFRVFPPTISFILNDRYITVSLEDFKNYINDIWESQGNRSEKSYKAKKSFDAIFYELLSPYIDYSNIKEKPYTNENCHSGEK